MTGASLQWSDQGRERVVGGATASMMVLCRHRWSRDSFALAFLPADPPSRTTTHDPDQGGQAPAYVPDRPGMM